MDAHPKGIRMYTPGDVTRYIFFPQHIDLVRKQMMHVINRRTDNWLLSTPDYLYDSVEYLERATDYPLLWSPAYSSKLMLKNIHHGKEIVQFIPNETFKEAYPKMVIRPLWVHRRRDKERGLSDEQLLKYMQHGLYIHGFDKNMQYLGACVNLRLPNQHACQEVSGDMFDKKTVGFWEYEIQDVAESMFNSYDCYCPLSRDKNWASTSLIQFARMANIKLHVKRGLVFDTGSTYLEKWAYAIWDARKSLQNESQFPDVIASSNAQASIKKYYIDMMGQFCSDFSEEYRHKEWNTMVVHEAIARQGYSLLTREEVRGNIVLVSNDAFYLLSSEPDPYKAYPTLLKYEHELRGYKSLGSCKLTDDIIDAFRDKTLKAIDIEPLLKMEMRVKHVTI
jgi:hypothetical protein